MDTDRKWVVVRIDGKIAAISTDYRLLAEISSRLAEESKKASKGQKRIFGEIAATSVSTTDILELRQTLKWEDLMLFGTEFQKKVWRMLWKLTHSDDGDDGDVAEHAADIPRLICYSDFAEMCQNRAGVRAVAHAIGLNPVSVVIPCHLIIPKEAIDKIKEIQKKSRNHHLQRRRSLHRQHSERPGNRSWRICSGARPQTRADTPRSEINEKALIQIN